ncbi:ISAon1 family transposase N-terminal region protein [Telluribacter humicola]|uniref:ISAon1 family transposase N-terminal region protein n=1 Tax=Telluribacter humicola TaxID=1720261 RepID=UPI001A9757AC|nr:transposase [Telluribacter humicola]
MESFLPLVAYLLPDFLVKYYQLTRVEQFSEVLHVYLEEKNLEDTDPSRQQLLSKGFLSEITIQDFPIRDRRVFLHIKRRRWLNTRIGKVEQRDWSEVAQGTRMTKEFADFLKQISR